MIAVSIYCYLINYQAKQKHLLPFRDTKLKQFCVGSINWEWVIKLKNRTYYFFNDFINIENFDPNNIKIDETSYKKILTCYVGYVAIKKYLKINNVNPFYFIFRYMNGN